METNKHYNGIDGLRTLGCLGIIAMHIRANTNYDVSGYVYNAIIPSFTQFVYLFMLISAFGLCCGYYSSLRSGIFDPNRFYKRRYGKLWLFFALVVLLEVITERTPQALAEAFVELTMVFGLLPNNELSIIGVSWTLGIIFVFYYLFPFFIFLLWSKRRAWCTLVLSLIVSTLCQEYFFTEKFVIEDFTARHSFLFCIPFFLGGGLLFLYREQLSILVKRWRLASFLICSSLTVIYYYLPDTIMGVDILVPKQLLVFVPWLAYAISVDSIVLCNPITKYLSNISMEMYLAHMIAFRVVEKIGLLYILGNNVFSYLLTFLLTLAVLIPAIQLYRLTVNKLSAYIHTKTNFKTI